MSTELTPSEELPAGPPPPPPRFEVEPYQPDGIAPPAGLALLLGGLLMAAVVLGFLTSLIARWFYLVVIFPLALGGLLGVAGLVLVKKGRVRNPFIAMVAGGLGGMLIMASMHYFDYLSLVRAIQVQLAIPWANLIGFGFLEYMNGLAEQGVTIGKFGQKNPINLGYYGSIIYWVVEAGLAAGIAGAVTRSAAREPYCTGCATWKEEKPLASLETADPDGVRVALLAGDLGKLLSQSVPPLPTGLLLKVAACSNCGTESTVRVTLAHLVPNKKGEVSTKELAHVTYPGAVLRCMAGSTPAQG